MSVFIVAEAGVNHLGDRAKMLALCDAAKVAGADAVKFQAYQTEALCKRRGIDVGGKNGSKTWALLSKSELSDADLDAIAAHCKSIGLKWFCSVFDPSQIERVLSRGACALKIGHAEGDYRELISACWHAGPRVWQSTHLCEPGRGHVWCIAEYPAVSEPHLGYVGELGFSGFSSHYTNYRIPAAAALRGAEYIEAHLKLSDTDPEAAWSLNTADFTAMVKLIREYERWL